MEERSSTLFDGGEETKSATNWANRKNDHKKLASSPIVLANPAWRKGDLWGISKSAVHTSCMAGFLLAV